AFCSPTGGSMRARLLTRVIALCLFATLTAWAQQQAKNDGKGNGKFQVTSTTFTDGGTIPLIMVWNQCSFYPGGGNQSPELPWTKVPGNTRSFAVVMYDVTASFTHWAIYNISPQVHELPQNAGISGSPYGAQVLNDYGVGDLSYDGPCPPPIFNPVS